MPVWIYLPQEDQLQIKSVINFIDAFGFVVSDDFSPKKGSWRKEYFAKTKDPLTYEELVKHQKKMERAIELAVLHNQQAEEVDKTQAEATSTLVNALNNVREVILCSGSIITAKSNNRIISHILTPEEMGHFDKNPNLYGSPEKILEWLFSIKCNRECLRESERRINVWISERSEGLKEPLWVGESYTLNFKVGHAIRGSLLSGPKAIVPSSDVPDEGLDTDWRVISHNFELASITSDTTVDVISTEKGTLWTAKFSLHIPKDGESAVPKLRITPRAVQDAYLDVIIYARQEIYRQFIIKLAVEERVAESRSKDTDLSTVRNEVIHAPARQLNLRATHEWTKPPGKSSIGVMGDRAYVKGAEGAHSIDQLTDWYGAQGAGLINNVRSAANQFRGKWGEIYLNDINLDNLTLRLQRWVPEYDWTALHDCSDDSHRQHWKEVQVSSELHKLAHDGYRLYETFFPADSKLRTWLDSLTPGHHINISWQPRIGWVHIPWGLMYRLNPPALGEPVDPMDFLALRFRIGYTVREGTRRDLGTLDSTYRAHFLYWGKHPQDPISTESRWQRQQWASWKNQVFVPVDPSGTQLKRELQEMLRTPAPPPMAVLYLFCQCKAGAGNDPVLGFSDTSQAYDVLTRYDLATEPLADRPLVFANACTTSAADLYANELEEGFFARGCRAYLGTEAKVPIQLASRFASIFFHFFYRHLDPQPMAAGEAVAQTRLFLWTHYRNIGGIFYTYVNQYDLFMANDNELKALRT